jgi:hypothetical protein
VIIPRSDQYNADDLVAGPITVTIREVKITPGSEQPVSILIEDSEKAFRPCKSSSRVLVMGWGPDASKYVGRSLTLYRDADVKWGGLAVGGIRISHMSDLATFTAMPELDAFVMEKKVKLDELQSKRPELYDKVSAARSDKVAELASADGFDAVLEAAE